MAVAQDNLGRADTNTVVAYLPTTVTFAYDLNGNMRTNGSRIYEYDDENQLIDTWVSGVSSNWFAYDGKMRRRITRDYTWNGGGWVLGREVHYLYDGNLVIQERDQQNLPQVAYTRGKDLSGSLEGAGGIGGLLAFSAVATLSPQHYYYHADGNGNVTALLSANEQVAARYLYDPFGNILSASGPMAEVNLYRFSSKEFHPASGLVYYLCRFYDPNLQRWPNRDPIEEEGGLNLYGFVGSNPINQWDRFGLNPPITVVAAILSGDVAQMEALLAIAEEVGLTAAQQAALRQAITKAAAVAAAAAAAAACKKAACDKEWDAARKQCAEALAKPNPDRGLTGGYDNIEDCAKGLVSEPCGGNPVSYPKPKPRKHWKF